MLIEKGTSTGDKHISSLQTMYVIVPVIVPENLPFIVRSKTTSFSK
jgi:hypothetical protein